MPLLVKHEQPVEAWLASLPERKRSAALQYAAGERSIVASYLFCSLLGLDASIDDWEAFALQRWKKLDHRAILETEIMALHDDIAEIRRAVEEGKIRLSDAPTKISYLSKELRGHIEHLSREVNAHDRRSLLLAGVEIASKSLRKVFGRDANVWPAIEATMESVFADIESKNAQ
jgi:dGTP triphosphohydrolase